MTAATVAGRDEARLVARSACPPRFRLTIVLVFVAFVALIAFWTVWFVNREWVANLDTESYFVFENAFPAADGWLTLACGAGAWALWKRKGSGLFWLLVGGSSSIYLGCMDVLFDLENGVYRAPKGDWGAVGIEIAINLYALGVGAWALWFGWSNRRWFLAREASASSSDHSRSA
jgi:hypothetical protein